MVKPKASWKGLDRKLFLNSDLSKDLTECLCPKNLNATWSMTLFIYFAYSIRS